MNQIDNRQRGGGRAYSSRKVSSKSASEASRRTGQAYRTGSPYQQRRGKKRRKGPQYNITKILLAIILAVASFICIMAAVKLMGGSRAKETEVNTTTVSDPELRKEVKVEGITITGMSREEAREAIEKQYPWGMKVTYNQEEYKLKNLMDKKVDALLDEIYSGEPKESYTLDSRDWKRLYRLR